MKDNQQVTMNDCMVELFSTMADGGEFTNPLWLYAHDLLMESACLSEEDISNLLAALFLSIETGLSAIKIMHTELSSDEYKMIAKSAGKLTNSNIDILLTQG